MNEMSQEKKEKSDALVVAVSSRALFDLEKENEIFEKEGIKKYRAYQEEHENEPLHKGTAFYLVESLLQLNKLANKRVVEVVVASRNSPETGVRMLNSINQYNLDIERVALSGGESLVSYLEAFNIDLFLSKDESDVQKVIDSHICAAALIYAPPKEFNPHDMRVKIAFDADAVLFSDESEYRYKKEGFTAFSRYETEHEDEPLKKGPFANLLIKLSRIQEYFPSGIELSPLRLAVVTSRSLPSHMRVIKTLKKWGVYVDEAYFLGGLPKDRLLKAFGAHIFFDDQDAHLSSTSRYVPAGKVPYLSTSPMKEEEKLEEEEKEREQEELAIQEAPLDSATGQESAPEVDTPETFEDEELINRDTQDNAPVPTMAQGEPECGEAELNGPIHQLAEDSQNESTPAHAQPQTVLAQEESGQEAQTKVPSIEERPDETEPANNEADPVKAETEPAKGVSEPEKDAVESAKEEAEPAKKEGEIQPGSLDLFF